MYQGNKKILMLGDMLCEIHNDHTHKNPTKIKGGGILNALINLLEAPFDITLGTFSHAASLSALIDRPFVNTDNVQNSHLFYQFKLPVRQFDHYQYFTNTSALPDLVSKKQYSDNPSLLTLNSFQDINILYLYDHGLDFWSEERCKIVTDFLIKLTSRVIVFMDSRYPLSFLNNLYSSCDELEKLFKHSFFLKANEAEMEILKTFISSKELFNYPANFYSNFHILNTRASKGSAMCSIVKIKDNHQLKENFLAPSPRPNIISPNNIGCGDSFSAFFLIGFLYFNLSLQRSLQFANIAGNIQASETHQTLPSVKLHEIINFLLSEVGA